MRTLRGALLALLVLGVGIAVLAPPTTGAGVTPSVHFTAVGDLAATTATTGVLDKIATQAPDLSLALGDLSYGTTGAEQAWCDLVTSRLGSGFPFELLAGNHESSGQNGNINDFSACLPNQLPGVVGTYGRQWYVDYPRQAPLVRFIMISPDLPFSDGTWSYAAGSPRYLWTSTAIDGARTAGVPWVVVGMHKPCLSLGSYGCDPGSDLMNMLIAKKVDLVLTGHEHGYQRTKQLGISGSCPALATNKFSASCVVDAGNSLYKDQGTVFATVGTGGQGLRDMNPADSEAGYFAAWSGLNANPTYGVLDVALTSDQLTAQFLGASGAGFTDSFVITRGTPPVNQPPIAWFASSCGGLACTFDGSPSSDSEGTVASYAWTFGDGGTGTGASPSHTYTGAGTYPVTLTVTDNGGAPSVAAIRTVIVAPTGGAGSPLVAVPASVDFGDVTVAGSSTQNLVLKNTSATATTVTAVSAPSAPFSATLPAAGASVAAGGSVTVPVRFAPTVEITSTGTLSVTTSGGTVTVPITGTGVALPPPPPPPPPPPGGTALPVPGVGVWSFNGAAVMSGSDLVLNPVATSSRGSSFYPSAVPSEGLRATFTAVIGGGTGADGLTLALVDASKAGSTSLGASGGGLGLAGVPGFGVALKTTYTSALSSSNVAGVVSSVSGSTKLTWVSQKALAVALRTGTHVVSVSVTGGHVLVDVDGVRVLDTVVTLPPNVLVGFTGATGAKTDQHAVRNVTITRA